MLTQSLGLVGSDFECNFDSSDWKLMTMQALNSIENGLQDIILNGVSANSFFYILSIKMTLAA